MQNHSILRIGVCSCSSHYQGKLSGRTLTLRPRNHGRLARSRTLHIQEITIPESGQRDALRACRCHFFLDLHRDGPYSEVELIRNVFWNGPGRRCCIVIGGTGHDRARYSMRTGTCQHCPPRPTVILRFIHELLTALNGNELNRWLQSVTPAHWCRPAR